MKDQNPIHNYKDANKKYRIGDNFISSDENSPVLVAFFARNLIRIANGKRDELVLMQNVLTGI